MNDLRSKIIKNSTSKYTDILLESKLFNEKDVIPTRVPIINVGLSGAVDGGLIAGVTMFAGPSKNYKTGFALLMAKTFQEVHPNGIVLFYDSEFGAPKPYFEAFNINMANVVHTPITDIEELKHDLMTQLQNIDRGEKVLIIIDSIGNLASRKEVEDAIEGKSVADMTRAKAFKSLFRMITPHLALKNIPLIAINHTYKEIGMYPKDVVGGGTGAYYGADNIWIIGRQQEKKGDDVIGFNFVINVEKSRFVREKSKFIVTVLFNGGIHRWSGLFDFALEHGYISAGKKGWYHVVDRATGEIIEPGSRRSDLETNDALWTALLKDDDFTQAIEDAYKLNSPMVSEEYVDSDEEEMA